MKDLEKAIDEMARKYPSEICDYHLVAVRINHAYPHMSVNEQDITDYYEGAYQQACKDMGEASRYLTSDFS